MGPSGVGKTTLLLTILGYQESGLSVSGKRIQEGKILPPSAVPEHALYIPQQLPFNPNWEVQGFLRRLPSVNPMWWEVLPRLWEMLPPFRTRERARVKEVLEQLGLSHRARATVAELSGGEAQRAALAQMLLLKPKLLIGDEFVSALDPGMTTWILDICRQEVVQSGGAAILAMHDVQSALQVSDRIILMWPASISSVPWVIHKGSRAWHGGMLFTLSCLARWAKDTPTNRALHHLISRIHTWLQDEQLLHEFLCTFGGRNTIIVDDGGEILAQDMDSQILLQSSVTPDNWADMMPIRLNGKGLQLHGIVIPKGEGQRALSFLARAGNKQES